MFDRAIIDTDRFMDMGISSKAMYFLLGMEADDEGFVSYRKVMRIHGGNEDDIGVLVAKGFIIRFPTGVVVITDWNKNNWLDVRRTKPTEYQTEKKMLMLTDDKMYVLSTGLASVEENRGEQSKLLPHGGEGVSKSKKKDHAQVDQFFNDRFWPAYPKKIAKATAMKAMRKADPDVEVQDTMIRALEVHKKTEGWLKKSGAFVPYPATWINAERYKDEIEVSDYNMPETAVIEN